MPYNAPSALKIVPETGEVSEVGSFARGGWKWHGGARAGEYIIGIPSHAGEVLRIDPRTDEVRAASGRVMQVCAAPSATRSPDTAAALHQDHARAHGPPWLTSTHGLSQTSPHM